MFSSPPAIPEHPALISRSELRPLFPAGKPTLGSSFTTAFCCTSPIGVKDSQTPPSTPSASTPPSRLRCSAMQIPTFHGLPLISMQEDDNVMRRTPIQAHSNIICSVFVSAFRSKLHKANHGAWLLVQEGRRGEDARGLSRG